MIKLIEEPRRNKTGIMVAHPEYLITGWQIIEYIEHISSGNEK